MSSPFPGMDPYLEGYIWPDLHQRLATEISRQLAPRLRPKYVARLAVSMLPDKNPETELGILYPDVEIRKRQNQPEVPNPYPTGPGGEVAEMVVPVTESVTIPRLKFEVRAVSVEIRDAARNTLVTSIEILSPVNKRGEGSAIPNLNREEKRLAKRSEIP